MFEADLRVWLTTIGLILSLLGCLRVSVQSFLDACFGIVDGYSLVEPLPEELKV
jgi:hypothetical protein